MGSGFKNFTLTDRLELIDLEQSGRLEIDKVRLRFLPYVSGVEVTQAIQYYKASQHLTDPADRGSDNSVALAAYKPAWVRVYVRSGFFSASTTMTGKLVVDRQVSTFPILYERVGQFVPRSPGIVVAPVSADYATERGTLGSTLNFVLPAEAVHGHLRITASIWSQGGDENSPSDIEVVYVNASLMQTLRVRGILVSYNGPNASGTVANMNLPAPTVGDLQTTCGNTFTVYPVETTGVFSSGGTIPWSTPLTGMATNPGGCSLQWLALNVAIAQARMNDGNRADVLYVGLIPSTVPIANVGGCNSSGVSAVPNGQQWTMAHELGHAAGLAHGPCGTPGDVNYPAYEPYDPLNSPTASLGEYGLDVNNGTVHPPREKDFMSYCGPPWISLYHHTLLYNNGALDPRWVDVPFKVRIPDLYDPWLWPWEYIPDPPPWELPSHFAKVVVQPVVSIIGIVNLAGEISVSSVMRVRAVPRREGNPTNMVAELVGANGEIVARAGVLQAQVHGTGCDCHGDSHDHGGHGSPSAGYAFQALLSDIEVGTALRIVRIDPNGQEENKEVWSRKPTADAPRIKEITVRVEKDGAEIRWSAKSAEGQQLTYSIQFSKDKGVSWNGLTAGLLDTKYRFSLTDMPSGSVVFRVLAHDGFHGSQADAKPVKLPPRAPVVSIVHPYNGRTYQAGTSLRLFAATNTHAGAHNPKLKIQWQIDGKLVGEGPDCWIDAPRAGKHKCRVVAHDDGGKSDVSINFVTEGVGD